MRLPVSAAVGSPTAVEATRATVETSTAVKSWRAAMEAATYRAAHCCAATSEATAITESRAASDKATASNEAGPSTESWTAEPWTTKSRTAEESTPSTEAVKPWASADEDTAGKPIRSIVAVGSTRIGVIPEVAVSARGRITNLGANPNANHNLRMRRSCCGKSENSE